MSDTRQWIENRTGKVPTPALLALLRAASEVGYGWFIADPYRWELGRSIDEDHWEEIVIWVHLTPTGALGFNGAHYAVRTIVDRTRALERAHNWIKPRREP